MKPMIRRTKGAVFILIGSVFFLLASACSQEDDVAAIRAIIQNGAALAEAHDISSLMELASEDIIAQPGGHNRLEIKRIIWVALRHYGQIKILYPKPSVELSAEENQASSKMFLLIVKKDRAVPELKDLYDDPRGWLETVGDNADLYQLEFEWLKTGTRWQVRRARIDALRARVFANE
ncbi:MAG: hypothetical protein R3274_04620 [Desulfobacterales bacterium]|nr:hypothetical protein [Desulfobacterales bacterium]